MKKTSSSDDEDDYLLSDHTWIPSLEELKKRGISVIKFDQHPGDLVFVNSNVYHWVWNKVCLQMIMKILLTLVVKS